jgi:hypothetical protein
MSVRAHVAHRSGNRVRLQLAEPHGMRDVLDRLVETLSANQLVRQVRANPLARSLVLELAGDPEELLPVLAASAALEILPAPTNAPARASINNLGGTDPVRALINKLGEGDPMRLAATLFAGVGVLQTLRGEIMLPALSAFWYATMASRMAKERETTDRPTQAAV